MTDTGIDTNRWVMNLSDRQISDDEQSILSKGLNFAITPTTLQVVSDAHSVNLLYVHITTFIKYY